METVQDIKDKVNKMAVDAIFIKPNHKEPESIFSSKLGGLPYWPTDMDYPQTNSESKKDLYLLAQINLSELPENDSLPKTGILQFFIAKQYFMGANFNESIMDNIKHNYGYRVIYHKEIVTDITKLAIDLPIISEDCELPLSGEYSLTFEVKTDVPGFENVDFIKSIGDLFDLPEDIGEEYCESIPEMATKMLGYQDFTQEDPRTDDNDFISKDKWINLFQLAGDDNCNIMWGDCGVGHFSIREEDLKNEDFSNIWYNWDCC